ncbi:uncharacterized protein LOC123698030 [Colias croceus]|uniref:uncharacterized protein LOC123698030 n=1 Tax=Colias crocea TaxID=72248 RepID=UPI001E2808AD|nr:uncharacterized protein LOC123698030 [Colias croceus]
MAKVAIIVPVLLFALVIKSSEAVRCWSCSSDLDPSRPDCNDPFLPGQAINPGYLRLENCDANAGATYPYLTQSKTACKKQKKIINGQLVVSRGCTWKRQDDNSNTCPTTSNSVNEVTIFCETCDYDGCNGAGALGKTLALLLVPISLLLFK